MRVRRHAISPNEQKIAAKNVANHIIATTIYQRSQHIAVYCAVGGEINLQPLIANAWAQGKRCYLPVVQGESMTFVDYFSDTGMGNNVFGIPEPVSGCAAVMATDLDLVLTPLVAFDNKGNRLGMGGGYYDRTFNFLLPSSSNLEVRDDLQRSPVLMGVAHACQEVDQLHAESWDVPLHHVATDQGVKINNPSILV
jgi:5-formyltetrahydrofolate cyclo-ligase